MARATKIAAVGIGLASLDKGPGPSHPCGDLAGVRQQSSNDAAISTAHPQTCLLCPSDGAEIFSMLPALHALSPDDCSKILTTPS